MREATLCELSNGSKKFAALCAKEGSAGSLEDLQVLASGVATFLRSVKGQVRG